MSNEFLSDPPSYKTPNHPETPYLNAKAEWDSRIGSVVVQAKNWRLACFGALGAALFATAPIAILASKNQVVPVIVGIDKERGETVVIGKAAEQIYQPGLQEVKYFISHFVTLVRSVPQDPVLIKQNWLKAYAFLRREAANLLNDMTNKDPNSPLKKIGEQSVIVQPLSVVQVAGGNSFQVRWEETLYSSHGNPIVHYTMTGIFTIELEAPRDEKTLNQNPLGLYITDFQWNKEL
jgi:type IV secretion system protein TrbF